MTAKLDPELCERLITEADGLWFSDDSIDKMRDQLRAALAKIASVSVKHCDDVGDLSADLYMVKAELEQLKEWRADAIGFINRALRIGIPTVKRNAGSIWRGGERIDRPLPPESQLCTECERARGDHRSTSPTPIETDDVRFLAWSTYLARWSLTYPCHLALRAEKQELGDGTYYLRIGFHYPDERDSRNGGPAPDSGVGLWPPSLYPDEDTPRWIRANILYHLNHELDEHLRLDGKLVFDPHHDSAYMCDSCDAKESLVGLATYDNPDYVSADDRMSEFASKVSEPPTSLLATAHCPCMDDETDSDELQNKLAFAIAEAMANPGRTMTREQISEYISSLPKETEE